MQKVIILLGFENEEKKVVVKHTLAAAVYFLTEPSRTKLIVLIADTNELQDFMKNLLLKWRIPQENILTSVVLGDGWEKTDTARQLLEEQKEKIGRKYIAYDVIIHKDHDMYLKEKEPCSA